MMYRRVDILRIKPLKGFGKICFILFPGLHPDIEPPTGFCSI